MEPALQVFGVTHDSHPGLDGHVFPNPVDPNTYVAMLVHKNGSLSREGTIHTPADMFLSEHSRLRILFYVHKSFCYHCPEFVLS